MNLCSAWQTYVMFSICVKVMLDRGLKRGVVSTQPLQTPGGIQQANFVNEDGLYDTILDSRKPEAKIFRRWITSEILPSIRKTGGYVNESSVFVESYFSDLDDNAKQFLIQTLESKKKLLEDNKAKQARINEMKPKEDFFDAVADSKDAISIGDLSKVLSVKGMGRNNLFEFLRQRKVLMDNNTPYQKYVDAGYFRVIEQKYMKDGEACINIKTLVYQKGVDFVKKLIVKQD